MEKVKATEANIVLRSLLVTKNEGDLFTFVFCQLFS